MAIDDPSAERVNIKHFLVEREGTIFLVAEIERYSDGDTGYDQVARLFESGYGNRELRATPMRRKDVSAAGGEQMLAGNELSEGAITHRFEPGD